MIRTFVMFLGITETEALVSVVNRELPKCQNRSVAEQHVCSVDLTRRRHGWPSRG